MVTSADCTLVDVLSSEVRMNCEGMKVGDVAHRPLFDV